MSYKISYADLTVEQRKSFMPILLEYLRQYKPSFTECVSGAVKQSIRNRVNYWKQKLNKDLDKLKLDFETSKEGTECFFFIFGTKSDLVRCVEVFSCQTHTQSLDASMEIKEYEDHRLSVMYSLQGMRTLYPFEVESTPEMSETAIVERVFDSILGRRR